jgi:glucokinase
MKGGSSTDLSSVEVVGRALPETDPLAGAALRYFVTWLGRFAGDAALFYGARGGVYLGGGIPPKILDALTTGTFRAAFEAKGRVSSYLAPIPIYVIEAADAGLKGAAVALAAAIPRK